MPERKYRTLSKRIVDRLAVNGKDAVCWDQALPGFGVCVYRSGLKVYVVQTRSNGSSKRVTIGRHGDIAPDQARKDAAGVIARLKAGLPPVETEPEAPPTVADLAERYRREYVAMHCKPLTVKHFGLAHNARLCARGCDRAEGGIRAGDDDAADRGVVVGRQQVLVQLADEHG